MYFLFINLVALRAGIHVLLIYYSGRYASRYTSYLLVWSLCEQIYFLFINLVAMLAGILLIY